MGGKRARSIVSGFHNERKPGESNIFGDLYFFGRQAMLKKAMSFRGRDRILVSFAQDWGFSLKTNV